MRVYKHILVLAIVAGSIPLSFNACTGGFQIAADLASSDLGPILGQEIPTDLPPASARFKFQCSAPEQVGNQNPGVKRLTKSELINTLKSVIGTQLFADSVISGLVNGMPDSESNKVVYISPTHTQDYVVTLVGVADRLTDLIEKDATVRNYFFGSCQTYNDSCAQSFITSFGKKVLRRPLSSGEVAADFSFYQSQGGGLRGLTSVLYKMIQAPSMAFHIEAGQGISNGRTRLTDYEIASRISYQTIASPPDQQLMAAADAGKLQDLGEVKAHVERLLASNSGLAKSRIKEFFTYYADLDNVSDPFQAVGDQHGILTFGLGDEMADEAFDYINHVFWTKKGDFKELMSSRDSFPRSENMRKILGANSIVGTNGAPSQADPYHIGLLHRPALLSTSQPRTAPILRGAHVRMHFLCDELPAAPQDAVNAVLVTLKDIENRTNRAKTELITGGAACAGCHQFINPIGFAFEAYDQMGIRRNQEVALNADESRVGIFPIDTRVTDPRLEEEEVSGRVLNDSIDLALAMANGSKARSCFAQRAFEFIQKRKVLPDHDGCGLAKAESVAHTGSLRDVIIHSIANESIFWRHARN